MFLSMGILLILLGCWINGSKKGLVAMVISTATYFLGWVLARIGAKYLGIILSTILPSIGGNEPPATGSSIFNTLTISNNQFFYNGIGFLIIFYGTAFISRWLLKRVRFLKKVPIVGTINGIAGGALDIVIGYLIIFMLLMVLQMWPGSWWQNQLATSGLAQWIITSTPGLARSAINWFV